jgi:hypothetical protein
MSTQQVDDLIQRERRELEFPAMPAGRFDDDDGLCDCASCRAERAGLPAGLDLPPGLEEMVEEMGPEAVMRALEDLIGGGPGPKRRKRRSRPVFGDDDVPF